VKEGNERLMGFGHRVYKNYDPRAKIIKKSAEDVFEVTGTNPLLEIALELEKIALEDDYFVKRKLYPNVDFYSGLIYEAFQFPPEMFTVLFAIGRTPGWLAQWLELVQDKEQKIARPKQIYTGDRTLDFVPASERWSRRSRWAYLTSGICLLFRMSAHPLATFVQMKVAIDPALGSAHAHLSHHRGGPAGPADGRRPRWRRRRARSTGPPASCRYCAWRSCCSSARGRRAG
jgi:hypothetical protein